MNRRNFLKRTGLASTSVFVPQFIQAFGKLNNLDFNGKKVIIIQLAGGNDGLNTIIPFRNDLYYNNRPSIAISKNNMLTLTSNVGLHKSLPLFKELYDQGEINIINNVGYPNPNLSHFRATDIWQTASDSNEFISTGWIGRYLDATKSKSHQAIELSDSLSMLLKGKLTTGIATKNPKLFYKATQEPFFKEVLANNTNQHLSEHNLGYLYQTMIDADSSAKYIFNTSKTFSTNVKYPNNQFAKQLKQIGQFINSGLASKVYFSTLTGFDTHVHQKNKQERLLKVYNDALTALIKDLKKNNTFKDTLILTFSEFGRRVKQNGSHGTDHGTANQVYLIGQNLKAKGLYNELAKLTNLDTHGNLPYDIDFRNIYQDILQDWLKVDTKNIISKSFPSLGLIR